MTRRIITKIIKRRIANKLGAKERNIERKVESWAYVEKKGNKDREKDT